ncbi:hypothetical protein PtrSN002B_003448 [Pyrenophora tritici-repentis]|uniref:MIP-T3 multi-domain protein n=1 Tax=Pyrenophora tritici-repentis TaxID=45151 RepID=A0A2W1G5Q7_9PLEO|nr:hypothetical protein PtrV1_11486 [Pyrenophora tritici-repentis]KAF7444287.1 hypothetical protein A1F99_108400 [Pyrenophora tritici-repentis]KAF7565063.1 MIP-T3 multi-domain protein [Pyrenophora tritici-repentis]KAG9378539.1 hypothetical protein A1F94_010308 [Pyrenophora tritici-repentis]KAI0580884.1 hypothetical protein Alg215_04986 [Pyrenophora tritici-repentis]
MCWSFNFGLPGKKTPKTSPSSEKKRRDRPSDGALRGEGRAVAEEISEKRSSKDSSKKRRSADSTPRSPRSQHHKREREEHRPRSQLPYEDAYRSRERYRPAQHMQVPQTYHRSAEPASVNSSQETLLNPRPHRSQHHRRRHPNQASQSTLRGRGAKRDPPRHSKSKKNIRPEPSRGWSLFAPSPPKTPKRESRSYNTLDSSPRSHRSSRQPHSASPSQTSPESTRSHTHHHRSRQHQPSAPSTRQARSRTPNTTARRVPDRRFAVLAATNQALEEVRQEAFAAPSPPPRRERLRRYDGVTIPTSQIPFNWDCVSSSQTSAGHGGRNGESSTRQRRSRR